MPFAPRLLQHLVFYRKFLLNIPEKNNHNFISQKKENTYTSNLFDEINAVLVAMSDKGSKRSL